MRETVCSLPFSRPWRTRTRKELLPRRESSDFHSCTLQWHHTKRIYERASTHHYLRVYHDSARCRASMYIVRYWGVYTSLHDFEYYIQHRNWIKLTNCVQFFKHFITNTHPSRSAVGNGTCQGHISYKYGLRYDIFSIPSIGHRWRTQ